MNSKVFEIPYFDNIFLDYKATKEFSKYLTKVEIIDYKFKVINKRIWRKKKTHNQDFIWKARFYFSQIPRRGKLEIFYL